MRREKDNLPFTNGYIINLHTTTTNNCYIYNAPLLIRSHETFLSHHHYTSKHQLVENVISLLHWVECIQSVIDI